MLLTDGLHDPDPTVRRTAAEIAGWLPGTGRAHLARLVEILFQDRADICREAAAFALGEIGGDEAATALVGRVPSERSPLVREAIAAALGAAGRPDTAPVVVGMTQGEKPAVRRRAVVACAAFDTPEAEDAIRRALEDRDRFVREAAEWLLRPPR
jgi:HEAT repeat protein